MLPFSFSETLVANSGKDLPSFIIYSLVWAIPSLLSSIHFTTASLNKALAYWYKLKWSKTPVENNKVIIRETINIPIPKKNIFFLSFILPPILILSYFTYFINSLRFNLLN